MKTILTARWSTLAIAVAAATSMSAAVAQEFQSVDAKLKVTERTGTVHGEKVHMSLDEFAAAQKSTRYLIEMVEPAVAIYKGGIAGFAATSAKANGQERLDVKSKPVQNYAQYLQRRQDAVLAEISKRVPELKAESHMTLTFNGVIVDYKGGDLKEKLRGVPGVKAVHEDEIYYVDMDASNDLINTPDVWQMLGGQDVAGQGVNVAVIDTGIDFAHPMFADNGHDAAVTAATDDYCATNPGSCNDKLAVARYFPAPSTVHPNEFMTSPQDMNGHGSHVAGTSVGNPVSTTYNGIAFNFSGVAPGANLFVYKALWNTTDGRGSGLTLSLADALEAAAADGADVINNSWGGGAGGSPASSYYTPIMKSLDEMGVVTVTSAGNSGPGPVTVGCPGCIEETITVASTQTGRVFVNDLEVTGFAPIEANLGNGDFEVTAPITADLLPASQVDAANVEACAPFAADAFAGQIALVTRGTCSFEQKSNNVQAAGAVAMVLYNNVPDEVIIMTTGASTLPSASILQADGQAIEAAWTAGMQATINPNSVETDAARVDIMSDFSSRGPNGDANMLKPEIAAPGHDILSAAPGQGYTTLSGTSMAGPHVAGAAALVLAHNPALEPQQVKSILMTSSKAGVKKEDGETAADPFDVGAGRLEMPAAFNTGITFDTASLAHPMCMNVCTFTRQVTNLDDAAAEWHVSVEFLNPNITVTYPDTVTLDASGSAEFAMEINGSQAGEDWQFGTVTFTDASGTYADARLPVAVYTALSENTGVLSSGVTAGELVADSPITMSMIASMGTTGEDVTITAQFPSDENFVVDETSVAVTETLSTTTSSTLDTTARTYTWVGSQTDSPPVATLSPAPGFPFVGMDFDTLAGFDIVPTVRCDAGCDESALTLNLEGLATWEYEGVDHTLLTFWENGVIEVGGNRVNSTWQIQPVPDAAVPNGILAPMWSDFETEAGEGELRYGLVNAGADMWLVFEWYNVQEYGDTTGVTYTFNTWFRLNTGEVYYNYIDVNQSVPLATSIIGVESMDGSVGSMAYATGAGYYPINGEAFIAGMSPGQAASVQIDLDASVATFGDVAAVSDSGAHSNAMSIDLTDAVGAPKRDLLTLLNVSSGTESYDAILPLLIKPDGALSVEITAQPENGTLTMDGMTATFTPTAGWTGTDSFSYRVVDAAGSTSTENTVQMTVTNTAPAAAASAPETAENGDTVELNASASSDAEGDALTYTWTQTAGPEIELADADTAVASFVAPLFEEDDTDFTFSVTVSDGLEESTATLTVTVLADPNTAPVISINAPSSVTPDTVVVLNAAGTTDAEDDTLTFQWQFIGGATVSLSNANTAAASFTAPRVDEDSEANFMLTVSDGRATSQQTVTVAITAQDTSSGSFGWLFTLLALPLVWLRRRKV
ncbi:S8 family serine peptidase [Pseudidiomarina gelatinasegens]|uniref:S8 family serine peptidase n=1 Tax=Pseudidiomarina gelatinasegens TaxID=2487740 RepID=UPI003A977410